MMFLVNFDSLTLHTLDTAVGSKVLRCHPVQLMNAILDNVLGCADFSMESHLAARTSRVPMRHFRGFQRLVTSGTKLRCSELIDRVQFRPRMTLKTHEETVLRGGATSKKKKD